MLEFLVTAKNWIWEHHRVLASSIVAVFAGAGAAYLVAEVLRRLDRGGRSSVGWRIAAMVGLTMATLAGVTIATMSFANTGGTRIDVLPPAGRPGASALGEMLRALHPADYAYISAILVFGIGISAWAVRRRRNPWESVGTTETSWTLIGTGGLLLITLWVFQRGVEQLKPETRSAPEFFGTIAGAGVLAMAIVQGLRTLLPLRGVFHQVTLERWIEDATSPPSPRSDDDDRAPARVTPFATKEAVARRRRILRSLTRLARGPVSADRYALLDLPIEQLCGQIAAGADRLLDAPFPSTLETRGSKREPATVQEVLKALTAGDDKEIDDFLSLARKMVPETTTPKKDDTSPAGDDDDTDAGSEAAVPAVPSMPMLESSRAQEYVRLRAGISQRIQRNIDGLQISTTFWWRRVLRSLVFTICGVLGLSLFNGRMTYTVMCAIVGGFVATAARDLIAIAEKARR